MYIYIYIYINIYLSFGISISSSFCECNSLGFFGTLVISLAILLSITSLAASAVF